MLTINGNGSVIDNNGLVVVSRVVRRNNSSGRNERSSHHLKYGLVSPGFVIHIDGMGFNGDDAPGCRICGYWIIRFIGRLAQGLEQLIIHVNFHLLDALVICGVYFYFQIFSGKYQGSVTGSYNLNLRCSEIHQFLQNDINRILGYLAG